MQGAGYRQCDGELIDLIYAALLGEASWQDFLDRLSDNAPDGRTILFSHNMSQSDEYLAMTSRCDGPEIESYAAHYVNLNPWLPHCAIRRVGLGVYSDEIVPPEQLRSSEFYNDWLAPNDIACSVGVTIDKHGDCPLIISTVTSRGDPELNSEFSDQLTRIAPHLRRAARFYRNSATKWAGFEKGVSLFDAVNIGVLILNEDRRIRSASPVGQKLLDSKRLASVSPLGQIRLRSEDAQTMLQAMLKRTYSGEKSVSLVIDDVKITLVQVEKDRISLCFEGPTVVILMEADANKQKEPDIERIAAACRLTPSERRALSGIIDGKTVSQIADEAGLSRETIRTQLKNLYAKTDTGGQADLLRLVHSTSSHQKLKGLS